MGVRLFLSLFAVSLRFSLRPSCHLAVAPFSACSPLSLLPLSLMLLLEPHWQRRQHRSPLPRAPGTFFFSRGSGKFFRCLIAPFTSRRDRQTSDPRRVAMHLVWPDGRMLGKSLAVVAGGNIFVACCGAVVRVLREKKRALWPVAGAIAAFPFAMRAPLLQLLGASREDARLGLFACTASLAWAAFRTAELAVGSTPRGADVAHVDALCTPQNDTYDIGTAPTHAMQLSPRAAAVHYALLRGLGFWGRVDVLLRVGVGSEIRAGGQARQAAARPAPRALAQDGRAPRGVFSRAELPCAGRLRSDEYHGRCAFSTNSAGSHRWATGQGLLSARQPSVRSGLGLAWRAQPSPSWCGSSTISPAPRCSTSSSPSSTRSALLLSCCRTTTRSTALTIQSWALRRLPREAVRWHR